MWEVGVDDLELQVPRFRGGYALSLTYSDDPVPISIPPDAEVVDLVSLWQQTRGRARKRPKPQLSDLTILPPESEEEDDHWVVSDFGLADALGAASNYEAQSLVQAELARADRRAFDRVHFDSEGSCFFAYCETESDAQTVRRAVERLVAEPGR